jgi:aspartyl-tRNA(Asn)/glutamyl-tRNA(Gln) amidotransferase subunit C
MLTKEQVQHIADLARLQLSEAEIEKYREQLSEMLSYFEQLQKLDTTKVVPMSHASGVKNVLREDTVIASTAETREGILSQAPMREGDLFKVKGVFQG